MTSRRYFELLHHVSLEETNALGNVYFSHHVRWQGRCREAFLAERAPEVLALLGRELDLVTLRCSCEYLTEVHGFETVSIRLSVGDFTQQRITLRFEYWRISEREEPVLLARGEQVVACMQRRDGALIPCALPQALREALRGYV